MIPRRLTAVAIGLVGLAAVGPSAAVAVEPTPSWRVDSLAAPTNFAPGDTEHDYYEVEFTNAGGAVTDGTPITLVDTLPAALTVNSVQLQLRNAPNGTGDFGPGACETETAGGVSTVSCTVTEGIPGTLEPARVWPGEQLKLSIRVSVPGGASGALVNQAEVDGGGAAPASGDVENEASAAIAPAGFASFENALLSADGSPDFLAGSRPYQYATTFAVNTRLSADGKFVIGAGGILKDINVALPPGLIGNPTATKLCTAKQFTTVHLVVIPQGQPGAGNYFPNECPASSAVGVIVLRQFEGLPGEVGAIYNLVPPKGMPAQLGFAPIGAPIYIDTELRSDGDYGISAHIRNSSEAKRVTAATVILWGTPADHSHDRLRGDCAELGGTCPVEGEPPRPFLRLPTSCTQELPFAMSFDSWTDPKSLSSATTTSQAPTACEDLGFDPSIDVQPSSAVADSPTGLHVHLHIPQNEDPVQTGEADLKEAEVVLPAGLAVSPSSADGLASCSPAQVGLVSDVGVTPPRFDGKPVRCPDASKIGTVQVSTPLLDHPLPGAVYLAQQDRNPFGSLLAIYVAIDDPRSGVVVTLAGEVRADPVSGRLTTVFADDPQLPFEDFDFDFLSGSRAPLRTPASCGSFTTDTSFTPHSSPASGPPATPSSSFDVTSGPAGACPSGRLEPRLSAGLGNATAGTFSPFALRIRRDDGTGELAAVTASPPPGLLAKLAGIPYCPEAAIAQAVSRSGSGGGTLEASSPSCPAASRVGSVTAGAGPGDAPFYTHGDVYLAGPYKGAPFSLVATIPALAGPFDLGVVVDRIALQVDTATARVTAVGDRFPTILEGIPLDVRDLRVTLDRPNFTLAPTNCEPLAVDATVTGASGDTATATSRFQVGGCAALGFKPTLALKLTGVTHRVGHPALRAVLNARPGDANIGRAVVTLPPSEQIDNAHITNPCIRPLFNEGKCPPQSVLGFARAFSPLLDRPLEGPVYFRSNGGEHLLPDIVADLNGQLHIVLVGHVDSINSRLRTSFETVPDAPVTKFVLELNGGRKGLLVNNRNLCATPLHAKAAFTAQNGRRYEFNPTVATSCRTKAKRHRTRPRARG